MFPCRMSDAMNAVYYAYCAWPWVAVVSDAYRYRCLWGGVDLMSPSIKRNLNISKQGWKLTLARGELNSVRASGSSKLTSPVGEWEFYGDLSIIS